MGPRRSGRTLPDAGWVALAALYLFTGVSVVGYGVFALNPDLLPPTSFARNVYRSAFPLFSQAHIVLAAAVLAVALVRRGGRAWLPAAGAIYVLSFTSEFLGTGYGVPFGEYRYTALLGARLGGRVPWLIPLSWFLMALPSYALARYAVPGPGRRVPRLLLATGWLVAWDLALDPAMSFLTPYWVWGETGPYYGMPTVNLAGWALTGLVLMVVLEALGSRSRVEAVPVSWMGAYWAAMVLMPLGMLAAAGAWLAVAATGVAVLALGAVTALSGAVARRTSETGFREAPGPERSGRVPAVSSSASVAGGGS
ncbi:MAG: carotenoid biosynthesis protein [Gemmatimonadota bacterium]|jgi:putative membrane protein